MARVLNSKVAGRRPVSSGVMPQESAPHFAIQEHVGVGPVKLGMTRTEVRDALSAHDGNGLDQTSEPTLDYAFGNSLQIEYDDHGHAQFIGVGYYNGCGCDYTFHDRHIGEYSAQELFQLLAGLDGDDNHDLNNSEYYFPNIMMTVWDADSQYDYLGGESRPVYGQVGVANKQYHDAIDREPTNAA